MLTKLLDQSATGVCMCRAWKSPWRAGECAAPFRVWWLVKLRSISLCCIQSWLRELASQMARERRPGSGRKRHEGHLTHSHGQVLGCEALETGKYILHCEHDGLPLAVGCVTEADSCKVFLATGVVLTMSVKAFHDCADECVDVSSLVTFKMDSEEDLSENKCLLELQAGCRFESDALGGAEAVLCECEAGMEDSDDEGVAGADCPESEVRIGDSLLLLLADHTEEPWESQTIGPLSAYNRDRSATAFEKRVHLLWLPSVVRGLSSSPADSCGLDSWLDQTGDLGLQLQYSGQGVRGLAKTRMRVVATC